MNVVVDSSKDEVFVIADKPLTAEEKLGYARAVDKAGDVPNRVQFIESSGDTGTPMVASSGGGASVSGGVLLLVVGVLAAIWLLFSGRR